jgi:hypothetical protein
MTIVSVICEVAWGDRVVTRMTVWSDMPDGFGIGRALILATYAYESRMRRPPPEIELKSLGVSVPHILALRYHTMDGKTHIMEGDKILHMMAMMAAFDRARQRREESVSDDRGDRPPRSPGSQRSV